MKTASITDRQGICLFALFAVSGGVLFGAGGKSGRDVWIAVLLAILAAVPMLFIYARILSLFPEKSFFALVQYLFGRWFGGFLTLLFVLYALWQSAFYLRVCREFFVGTTLPNPPWLLLPSIFLLTALYLLRRGGPVLGKWAVAAAGILSVVFVLTLTAAFKDFRYGNLLPIIRREPTVILEGMYQTASVSFLDGILFLPFLSRHGKKTNRFKVLLGGLLLSGTFLLLVSLQNVLLLGEPMLERVYFPFFSASKVLTVGQLLTRLEMIVFLCIVFTGITKILIALSAAEEGFSKILCLKEPSGLAVPFGLTALAVSECIAKDLPGVWLVWQMNPYTTGGFFQFLLPILFWIGAEWKFRRTSSAQKRRQILPPAEDRLRTVSECLEHSSKHQQESE